MYSGYVEVPIEVVKEHIREKGIDTRETRILKVSVHIEKALPDEFGRGLFVFILEIVCLLNFFIELHTIINSISFPVQQELLSRDHLETWRF